MLTYRQIEDAGEAIVRLMAEAEERILNEMARRIGRLGELEGSVNWQTLRYEITHNARQAIMEELSRAFSISEQRIIELFDEAATRTLDFDNRVYRAAGYNPTPLAESEVMQQIVRAGVVKTLGEFQNLTQTTAFNANRQFGQALDLAHQLVASGRYSYEQAMRHGIQSLSRHGINSIEYFSGRYDEFGMPIMRMDKIDVAFRRALMTGINQTAAELQLSNIAMLGTDLVETSAHPDARPTHMVWQGKVFSISGTHPVFPDFFIETEYGTATGLCGINCRHSFFPFFEGLSEPAYTADELRAYNDKMVTYNGETMNLYDATQRQRYIERQIRRWKREASAYDAAGLDSSAARARLAHWQSVQRDFIEQTGLRRDYFRERGGVQNLQNTPASGIITLDARGREHFSTMPYDQVKDMRVSDLAARQWYDAKLTTIPGQINSSLPLEARALQAHTLRNDFCVQSRNLMADQQKRAFLDSRYPIQTFEQTILDKMQRKGITRIEALEDIILTAPKPNAGVNIHFGLEPR